MSLMVQHDQDAAIYRVILTPHLRSVQEYKLHRSGVK